MDLFADHFAVASYREFSLEDVVSDGTLAGLHIPWESGQCFT